MGVGEGGGGVGSQRVGSQIVGITWCGAIESMGSPGLGVVRAQAAKLRGRRSKSESDICMEILAKDDEVKQSVATFRAKHSCCFLKCMSSMVNQSKLMQHCRQL